MSVHFSSQSDVWATPQDVFDALNAEFHFTIDVAANSENAKCERFFAADENGLKQSWVGERVFCNPPYSEVATWIKKAAISKAETVVMLIPARTDTKAWHRWIFGNAEVRFIKGRLKFNGHSNSAPFPSAVIIFK